MESRRNWEPALNPEDLARFFVQRANAADVDGLVALYESGAVLAIAEGEVARGSEAIRAFYTKLLADKPAFEPGQQRPALRQGELAPDLDAANEWHSDSGDRATAARWHMALDHRSAGHRQK
jgi:acylphosphatase